MHRAHCSNLHDSREHLVGVRHYTGSVWSKNLAIYNAFSDAHVDVTSIYFSASSSFSKMFLL